jgi:hypothetical protein
MTEKTNPAEGGLQTEYYTEFESLNVLGIIPSKLPEICPSFRINLSQIDNLDLILNG